MGYQFWGETAHKWIGAGMFFLFIAHHILNFSWYRSILKGTYTAVRIVTLHILGAYWGGYLLYSGGDDRYSDRTGNSCYAEGNTGKSAGLPLCSIMTKGNGVTHFTELHRSPT